MGSAAQSTTRVLRGGLLLWGFAVAILAILELIEPGFLRSERSLHPALSRVEVLPGIISMMMLGALGLVPTKWLAARRRTIAASLVAAIALLVLARWAPARIGIDFSWSVVPHVLLVYGLPATLAILLGSRKRNRSVI